MIKVKIYNYFGLVTQDTVQAFNNLDAMYQAMHEKGFFRYYDAKVSKVIKEDKYLVDMISIKQLDIRNKFIVEFEAIKN